MTPLAKLLIQSLSSGKVQETLHNDEQEGLILYIYLKALASPIVYHALVHICTD